ncbi:MAG: hypothetical protein RSA02_00420 [Bacteroidales bacterium]
MKKINVMVIIGLSLISFTIRAQQAKLPFIGTINYQISYKSDVIPAATLAQQPTEAVVKISEEKLVMDAKTAKVIVDAQMKKLYKLLNLNMMGLGKYVLEENETILNDTTQKANATLNITKETKIINGYTTTKAIGSYLTPQGKVDYTVYFIPNFCNPFFKYLVNTFASLNAFPLEYTIVTPQFSTTFTVKSMVYDSLDPKDFLIPKSYKPITQAELEEEVQGMMGGE